MHPLIICVQDYEIDEYSQEYKALHPVSSKKQPSLVEEHFRPVMEDEDQNSDSDASATSLSSEDEPGHKKSEMKRKGRTPRLGILAVPLWTAIFCLFINYLHRRLLNLCGIQRPLSSFITCTILCHLKKWYYTPNKIPLLIWVSFTVVVVKFKNLRLFTTATIVLFYFLFYFYEKNTFLHTRETNTKQRNRKSTGLRNKMIYNQNIDLILLIRP